MAIGTTAAIIGASAIGAGASVLGGSRQASAATEAGQVSADAANRAADLQYQQFQQTRQDFEPYRQAGIAALGNDNGLMALLGLSDNTPQTAQQTQGQGQPTGSRLYQQPDGTYRPGAGGVPLAQNNTVRRDFRDIPKSQTGFNAQDKLAGGDFRQLTAAGYPATLDGYAQFHADTFGRNEGRNIPTYQPASPAANNNALGGVSRGSQLSQTEALRQTPGYQFRLSEGLRGVNSSLAARGVLNSGAAQRELMRVGQGMADQTYQNRVNNLLNVTNIGSGSAAQVSNAGSAYAANAGNALQSGANAQANAALNRGSAYNNALGGVANAAGYGLGAYGRSQGWEF